MTYISMGPSTASFKFLHIYRRGTSSMSTRGFTLLELVVVIAIIGVLMAVPLLGSSTLEYWRQDGAIAKLRQTISFLHSQAILDGVFYRLEFGLDRQGPYYRVGEIVPEEESFERLGNLAEFGEGAGMLSTELALTLHPSLGLYQNMIEPRSFPSLAEPVFLPRGLQYTDIRTMRGLQQPGQGDNPYIIFSPRGFSEFAVLHLQNEDGERRITILVNPFTGLTELYNSYQDFQWTYGRAPGGR